MAATGGTRVKKMAFFRIVLRLTLCLSLFLPASVFSQSNQSIIRYDSIHHPLVARYGMVVSQNATASKVGQQILAQGGNAVDAAVAVGFALAVTLPRAGNLGGSGFMLVHQAKNKETIALDYRSVAPLAATMEKLQGDDGAIDMERLTFGPVAPGIPGTVAGLQLAWQRYGSLPWAELLQPAYELASKGFKVSDDLEFALNDGVSVLSRFERSASIYLNEDKQALQSSMEHYEEFGKEAGYRQDMKATFVPRGQLPDHLNCTKACFTSGWIQPPNRWTRAAATFTRLWFHPRRGHLAQLR